jgi:hypothetical protein
MPKVEPYVFVDSDLTREGLQNPALRAIARDYAQEDGLEFVCSVRLLRPTRGDYGAVWEVVQTYTEREGAWLYFGREDDNGYRQMRALSLREGLGRYVSGRRID